MRAKAGAAMAALEPATTANAGVEDENLDIDAHEDDAELPEAHDKRSMDAESVEPEGDEPASKHARLNMMGFVNPDDGLLERFYGLPREAYDKGGGDGHP